MGDKVRKMHVGAASEVLAVLMPMTLAMVSTTASFMMEATTTTSESWLVEVVIVTLRDLNEINVP